MSIVKNFSDLDLTKSYTYSNYLMWQISERVELIRGLIMKMSPALNTNHQKISQNLNRYFYTFFLKKTCLFFVAPFNVRLKIPSEKTESTVVQPCISIICDEEKNDVKGCNGGPDLIVEMISPHNSKHDFHTKFNLYQEAQVKEYWLIESFQKLVLNYKLKKGEYVGLNPLVEGEFVKSNLFPEFNLAIEDIFYRVK